MGRDAQIAERLLRLFTIREHAAAIVGDLVENHDRDFDYWIAVLRTAIGLSRRLVVGILLASATEYALILAFNLSTRGHAVHRTGISGRLDSPDHRAMHGCSRKLSCSGATFRP
jgi:hypothetical protein